MEEESGTLEVEDAGADLSDSPAEVGTNTDTHAKANTKTNTIVLHSQPRTNTAEHTHKQILIKTNMTVL